MYEILLNKFEKEQKVIELHKQGKTLKDSANSSYVISRYLENNQSI
jgi:hypothetical protein